MLDGGFAWWPAVAGMAAAWTMTGALVRLAPRAGLIDVPNPRSSHTRATPRGGGLAIVAVVTVAAEIVLAGRPEQRGLLVAVLAGGGLVALVGLLDDRRGIAPLPRFAAHLVAAAVAVLAIGGPETIAFGERQLSLGRLGAVFALLGIVWLVNLTNFMDGVDGIAAGEGVFVGVAGALLLGATGQPAAASVSLVLAAASLGFLGWNWSPARIFMGDVGSGFVGFVTGVLILAAVARAPSLLWPWLILTGAFVTDATVTLLCRLLRRERVYQAHRSHAYQHLARRWSSHGRVTLAFLAVNLLWLAPWAWAAWRWPAFGWLHAVAALVPLAGAALLVGAGRPEASAG